MCSIYGDFTLLPKSKSHILKDHSKNEVLKARCACKDQPLATLVASYSSQHLLPSSHLRNAGGIFAELWENAPACFSFIDPARWSALLGNLFTLSLPRSVNEAFKCLGNSISTLAVQLDVPADKHHGQSKECVLGWMLPRLL